MGVSPCSGTQWLVCNGRWQPGGQQPLPVQSPRALQRLLPHASSSPGLVVALCLHPHCVGWRRQMWLLDPRLMGQEVARRGMALACWCRGPRHLCSTLSPPHGPHGETKAWSSIRTPQGLTVRGARSREMQISPPTPAGSVSTAMALARGHPGCMVGMGWRPRAALIGCEEGLPVPSLPVTHRPACPVWQARSGE